MSRAVAVRGAVWAPMVVMMVSGPAVAQEAGQGPAQLQRVEVQGDAVAQARRNAVGAMQVLGREELLRQGDTRLADALQRVPGITVLGSGGRGTEIRMSGLGGGYTQLLLNGEPVPPGFSLESLSPELIERVEIARSASVEQSSLAIAGSINIVLRRAPRSGQRSAKLGAATQLGQPTFSGDLQLGDRDGALAWGLGIGLSRERQRWPMWMEQRSLDADGRPLQAYTTDKQESERSTRLSLTPQASWTLTPNQTLSTDHLLRISNSRVAAIDYRDSQLGELPQFADNGLYFAVRSLQLRSRLNWALSEDDGTKWELKLGLTRQTRDSTADFRGYNYEPRWIRDAQVLSLAVDQGLTLSGRLRKPWREDHTLSLGWDAEENRRSEDRLQREQPLPGGLPVENLDEIYDARIRRLAMFVQDEWALSPAWTATLGLRWEGLQTISEGNVFEGVNSRSSVFSPALQARWRLPGSKDQIRLGLARSYKAPTPRELMPRRFVANNNSATTPDLQGNPALRPELAWGLDAAWEHPLAKGSQLTVSAYLKRIEHVIVDELFQQQGAWVLRRSNSGIAWVQGVDLEARLSLPQLLAGAPALDLRGNLALNRSRVAAVPGPDNRLAQQTPLSLSLGLDHRPAGSAFSWGGNFNYQAGGPQRLSLTRFADSSDRRTLDVYLHWKANAQTQWRLALSNLLHPDQVADRRVLEGGREHLLSDTLRTAAGVRLTLERAL
ncbi:MAG: TonB-dependent receptor [Burkholderiaceae bacterium]|nr:TonB-dependent receptor [Burkholderiaceae bacterium]